MQIHTWQQGIVQDQKMESIGRSSRRSGSNEKRMRRNNCSDLPDILSPVVADEKLTRCYDCYKSLYRTVGDLGPPFVGGNDLEFRNVHKIVKVLLLSTHYLKCT